MAVRGERRKPRHQSHFKAVPQQLGIPSSKQVSSSPGPMPAHHICHLLLSLVSSSSLVVNSGVTNSGQQVSKRSGLDGEADHAPSPQLPTVSQQ